MKAHVKYKCECPNANRKYRRSTLTPAPLPGGEGKSYSAYTLIGWLDDANVANQICGLRVAYYAPTAATYLPVVTKSSP